jgi:hypothetical protein
MSHAHRAGLPVHRYLLTEEHRRKLQSLRDQLALMAEISFAATPEEDDEPLQIGRSVLGMSYENLADQAREIFEIHRAQPASKQPQVGWLGLIKRCDVASSQDWPLTPTLSPEGRGGKASQVQHLTANRLSPSPLRGTRGEHMDVLGFEERGEGWGEGPRLQESTKPIDVSLEFTARLLPHLSPLPQGERKKSMRRYSARGFKSSIND